TITLTEGELRILESLEIVGLGADQLTISAGGASRLFQIGGPGVQEYVFMGLTLADGDTANGTDDRHGGAIRLGAGDTAHIMECVLRDNRTPNRLGGAIYASGNLKMDRSAVINSGSGQGTVYIQNTTADFSNSTFSGNDGLFGTIWARGSSIDVAHCSFIDNTNLGNGSVGSAVFYSAEGVNAVASVTYEHTLFARNARSNFGVGGTAGTITVDSLGYNILDDDSGDDTPDPTDLLNTDPQVGPLEARDGTFAHFPLFGSPALNAGDPAAVAGQSGVPEFDQRGVGFDRVLEGRIDIGAIESTPEPVACSPADVTTDATANGVPDGVVTLSDFSFYLSLWSQNDAAADITADGVCDLGTAGDGVTLSDFSCYLSLWSQGCP
ncbi:MAG: GC-type dockerin domain-anchored protein, partial [Planctomycetota bacterium]